MTETSDRLEQIRKMKAEMRANGPLLAHIELHPLDYQRMLRGAKRMPYRDVASAWGIPVTADPARIEGIARLIMSDGTDRFYPCPVKWSTGE